MSGLGHASASCPANMNKVCRQVSIESPSALSGSKESVFTFDIPVPDVPPTGARVKVLNAGVCYRRRDSTLQQNAPSSGACQGVRDAAFFPGYEVAGMVDEIGPEAESPPSGIKPGDKVVVYPYEGIPHGYADYISVPEVKHLVKIPDTLPLPVAAMLPTGALWAMNAVIQANHYIDELLQERGDTGKVSLLLVGTGGLALWAIRFAKYQFGRDKKSTESALEKAGRVKVTVASLKDEGITMVKESGSFNVVQWSEGLYEKQLIERTKDACDGEVDVVISFGSTVRTILRSLQCLSKGGIVLIGSEASDFLIRKFKRQCEDNKQTIVGVSPGTYEQLQELVDVVASGKVQPPPYSVFPSEKAREVIRMISRSEIQGRAILRFTEEEEE